MSSKDEIVDLSEKIHILLEELLDTDLTEEFEQRYGEYNFRPSLSEFDPFEQPDKWSEDKFKGLIIGDATVMKDELLNGDNFGDNYQLNVDERVRTRARRKAPDKFRNEEMRYIIHQNLSLMDRKGIDTTEITSDRALLLMGYDQLYSELETVVDKAYQKFV